ncbi:ATP12 family chaperone protein [Sphingomonas sp.]|uniref:ATP12 family chaperone protein n=1 Tax=Sphingomonas sp. TaxID=28214 RepID=UPI003B3B776A
MKRFYKEATVVDRAILLDGRAVRTPDRRPLSLPTQALARAVAEEWSAQVETIDPRAMPLAGLANAAIDKVAPDPAAFARPLAAYAQTDLLCYRADTPEVLAARQAAAWDPVLAWARRRYDVDFAVTAGIVHAPQPDATVVRLSHALAVLDPFRLTAMSPLVTIGGSLVVALAVMEGELAPDAAFEITHLDEIWQAERWGEDPLALKARDARRADFLAAARFLALLDAS